MNGKLIDTHVHTTKYSSLKHTEPHEAVKRARELGLYGLVFSENALRNNWSCEELKALDSGLLLVAGREVTTCYKDRRPHFITIGYADPVKPAEDAKDFVKKVHDNGGIVIAAHPAMRHIGTGMDFLELGTDAVETRGQKDEAEIVRAAKENRIAVVAGSDMDLPKGVGAYCTLFPDYVSDVQSLMRAIKCCAAVPMKLGHNGYQPLA
jgi:hypothetical protein